MRSLLFACVAFSFGALIAAACGGKAVVDDDGAGGVGNTGASGPASGSASAQGGSSTSSSPTSASGVPSTSATGPTPVCGCIEACGKLVDCGFDVPSSCSEACGMMGIPEDILDCLCGAIGCDFDECIGTSTSSGPGTGGGPPSNQCENCVEDVIEDECEDWLSLCAENPQCPDLFDCHDDCDWTPDCNEKCDAMYPGGVDDFSNALACGVCGECYSPCASSTLVWYCPIKEG